MRGTALRVSAAVLAVALFMLSASWSMQGIAAHLLRFVLLCLVAAAFGSWMRSADAVSCDISGLTIRENTSLRVLAPSDIAVALPAGGTRRNTGVFVIGRPWWRLPHLLVHVPETELDSWAECGIRVLGYGKGVSEATRRGNEFLESEDVP